MTKIMCLGFAMFAFCSVASVTMTPPVAIAWDAARLEAQANTQPSRVIVLDTIEIVGRVEMCREITIASR